MKNLLPLLALLIISATPAEAGAKALARRVIKLPVYILETTKDACLGFAVELATYLVFAP